MKSQLFRAAVAVICLCATVSAAALKSGDEAPKIRVGSWAQGEEVKELEGDKVYLVEFWATWCGPCVGAIPHLNEIQKKYESKGLVVIGQNLGEDSKTISTFIKGMGGKMSYRVTVDDKAEGGWMAKHWLTAAGQNGIPCAFVVSKAGKIAYIGHPGSLKESLLESLLAEPSTKPAAAAQPVAEAAAPSAKATALAARALAEIGAGKLDEAEATVGLLHEELSSNFGYIAGLLEVDLLLAKKKPGDAIELSGMLCEDYAKKPAVLVSVASRLIARPDTTAALRAAAEKIAAPLSVVAGDAQASALAVVARVAFMKGEKDRAVELQAKAVALTANPGEAAAKAALDAYKQGRLPVAL